jgi:glutamate-5-semialdehyde dehydrogenase
METTVKEIARKARAASRAIAACPGSLKDKVLLETADALFANKSAIQEANARDLEYGEEKGLSSAMLDRLTVKDATIASMAQGLREVAAMRDPVGSMDETWIRPNGLEVGRMRIPLGVVCMIYESRPNVTVDAAGLCLKAGNATILRGGSEALHSNQALGRIISSALVSNGLPGEVVSLLPMREREAVLHLLRQEESIDLVIPRGGEGLIRFVVENSRIPVLKHYKGVCHVFVDETADLDMALNICMNAKVQRPGVCNAMETLLVHKTVASRFLPMAAKSLLAAGVELRGCPASCALIPEAKPAAPEDFGMEFLDLILAVRVVDGIDEAMEHIARHGSQHTESIVTNDLSRSRRFVREVDASAVMVNTSTRFNDGGELGLGAEIGISTSKLHAFGPMSVKELTSAKFVVMGAGQVRK